MNNYICYLNIYICVNASASNSVWTIVRRHLGRRMHCIHNHDIYTHFVSVYRKICIYYISMFNVYKVWVCTALTCVSVYTLTSENFGMHTESSIRVLKCPPTPLSNGYNVLKRTYINAEMHHLLPLQVLVHARIHTHQHKSIQSIHYTYTCTLYRHTHTHTHSRAHNNNCKEVQMQWCSKEVTNIYDIEFSVYIIYI